MSPLSLQICLHPWSFVLRLSILLLLVTTHLARSHGRSLLSLPAGLLFSILVSSPFLPDAFPPRFKYNFFPVLKRKALLHPVFLPSPHWVVPLLLDWVNSLKDCLQLLLPCVMAPSTPSSLPSHWQHPPYRSPRSWWPTDTQVSVFLFFLASVILNTPVISPVFCLLLWLSYRLMVHVYWLRIPENWPVLDWQCFWNLWDTNFNREWWLTKAIKNSRISLAMKSHMVQNDKFAPDVVACTCNTNYFRDWGRKITSSSPARAVYWGWEVHTETMRYLCYQRG